MLRRISLVLLVLLVIGASGYAGVWLGQRRFRFGSGAPFTVTGTISGDETIIRAGVPGRIRLLAVAPGDVVKAGQLVAWLDAPELRAAVEQAEEAVRDAQRDLERLRGRRPGSVQEAYDRAKTEADAAQRALEDAQALSDEAPALAQRLAAAQARRDEAAAALAAAEARLAQVRAASGAAAAADGGALESPSSDAASGQESSPGGTPGQADGDAAAAVERARRRLEAAEQDLAEARRRERRARQAAERLHWLAQRATETASALEAARAALDNASLHSGRQDEEDRLRAAVREAQVAAARARARLKEAVVTTPVTGLVSRVASAAGGDLAAGDEIAAVQSLDPVRVEIILDAKQASRVYRNQPVVATAPAHNGVQFQGTVQDAVPQSPEPLSPWTVRVTLRNPAFRLRPGETVQVTFQ